MNYKLKIIINGVEVLEEQKIEKVDGAEYSAPSILDVRLQNNATLKTMEIGATACDCLTFTMLNPFSQSFDGQKVEFLVKPITTVVESLKAKIEAAVGFETTTNAINEAGNNTNVIPAEEEGEPLTEEELEDVEATAEANVEDTFNQLEGEADATTPEAVTDSEWHRIGVYYVQNQETLEDNKIRLTCYDGFAQLNGIWIPMNREGTTAALFEDLRSQIFNNTGIFVEPFEFGEEPLKWNTMSSYRTALGYFAGLAGGFVGFDEDGDVAINFYGFTDNILIKEELLAYTEDSAGEMLLTEISCNTSLDGINESILESGAGQGISFNNPYMTQDGLDAILADYTGVRFTGGNIKTVWNESLIAGEFIKVFTAEEYDNYLRLKNAYNAGETDLKESINSLGTVMLISSQVITFGGDAVSNINSVCSSEAAKENAQLSPSDAKFRNLYANSITTETLEAGTAEIQRLISENVDASQIRTGELDADVVNVKNINGNEIKSGTVLAAALSEEAVETFSGSKVYYQAEAPTGGSYNVNDSWYKTVMAEGDTDVLHVWNGTEWEPKDLDAKLLQAGTITALEIASNTIEANNINMDNLQTNIARVGDTDEKHIVIDSDSVDIMDGEQNLAQFKTETIDGQTFTVIESTTDTDRGVRLASSPTNAANVADAYIQTTSNNYNQGGADFGQGSFDALSRSNDNATERTLLSRIFSDTSRLSTTLNLFTSWVQNAGSFIVSKHEAAIRMISNSSKSQVSIDADEVKVNGKDLNLIGTRVAIRGKSGSITLGTSATGTNPLSDGRGEIDTANCSTDYTDSYTVSANSDTITIKKTGVYTIDAGFYFSAGFNTNDLMHGKIHINGSGGAHTEVMYRAAQTDPYLQISKSITMQLNAGDVVDLRMYNQSGARGVCYVHGAQYLHLTKII